MGSGTFGTLHSRMRELVFEKGMSFDEAAAQAQRECESHGPAPVENLTGRQLQEQLQNGLNEVLPEVRKMAKKYGGVYNSTLTPEQMEQRYRYSLKCRNVVTKIVEESVRRDKGATSSCPSRSCCSQTARLISITRAASAAGRARSRADAPHESD